MRLQNIIVFTVILATLFFAGCKKKAEYITCQTITFTVKGRLLKDCSGMPAANAPLDALFSNTVSISSNPKIGSTTTDSEGYFSIVCTSCAEPGVIFLKESWAKRGMGGIPVEGKDGAVIEAGTIYDRYTGVAVLQFNFAQPHADTLFIWNWPEADMYYLHPSVGTQFVRRIVNAGGMPYDRFSGYYGFGRAEVNQGHRVNVDVLHAFDICGPGDTTVINIP